MIVKEYLSYYLPTKHFESAVEKWVVWSGFFGDDIDGEAGRLPKNGSNCFFDGQAVFGFLEAFFVEGVSDSDTYSAAFGECRRASGEGE